MFEVVIHSNDCDVGSTHCVKVDLHSGDIEGGKRSSQGMSKVACCTEDLCNAAPAFNVWL